MAAPLRDAFEAEYRALYGHTVPDAPVDVVTWRLIAEGPRPEVAFGAARAAGGAVVEKARRQIWLPDATGFAEVPVYDRYALPAGIEIAGPCVVEERESTVVINGPGKVRSDDAANLVVELAR